MAAITIGVPFYNCEDTLLDTIKSIYAQTFQDWELILADDASTDGSLAIAESIKDSRVRVIRSKTNQGVAARRADIVEIADTEYLAWQDADDIMHPDRLAVQYDYLQKHPEVSIVDAWVYRMDTHHHIWGISRRDASNLEPKRIVLAPPLDNSSTLGRTEIYKRYRFDPSLRRCEDWDLWIRAMHEHKYAHIMRPLIYRQVLDEQGRPFQQKDLRSMSYVRTMLLRHGPKTLGWPRTIGAIVQNYARAIVRGMFIAVGLQSLLRTERISKVAIEELEPAERTLADIVKTSIPRA
ncbi:MAG: glycosyltransferase family 2 protein [Armatimonadota bacterium]